MAVVSVVFVVIFIGLVFALAVVAQAPVVRDLLIVSIRMYNCTMYADMGPQILGSILLSIWEVLF